MKNLNFSLIVFVLIAQISVAQLKVSTNGNVGIQLGTNSPLSTLSVGDVGSADTKAFIAGNTNTALKIQRIGSSGSINFGINASTNVNGYSAYWNYGLKASSYSSSIAPYARTYGVFGLAGGGTYANYGVFGQLAGSCSGSAVVGLVSSSVSDYTEIGISGMYAGYFVGDVKVTGLINGITVGNSDKRYKKNIVYLDSKKSLNQLLLLNPVEYNLNQIYIKTRKDSIEVETPLYDEKSQVFIKKHYGVIAQDLQKIYPDLVYEDENGYLSVNYIGIIPLLIESIKELNGELKTLKAKIDDSSSSAKTKE